MNNFFCKIGCPIINSKNNNSCNEKDYIRDTTERICDYMASDRVRTTSTNA